MKQFILGFILFLTLATAEAQEIKIFASNAADQDKFGNSVDIDHNYAVVGASQKNNGGNVQGSAYVYFFDGTNWVEQAILTPGDPTDFDTFGNSVSISGDYIIVGAKSKQVVDLQAGAAYIFHRTGTTWTEEAKLTASDHSQGDLFGGSVSINGDYTIIGAANVDSDPDTKIGAAYIFHREGTTWTEQTKILNPDPTESDYFGISVGIFNDNVVIGAHRDDDFGTSSGSAYIYQRSGTTWNQVEKIHASDAQPNDNFGENVDIHENQIIVGAVSNDDYGTNTGTVYVFEKEGSNWVETGKLRASNPESNDKLGNSVAIYNDVVIAAAAAKETVYIFAKDNGIWVQRAIITTTNAVEDAFFGYSVGITQDTIIIGAFNDDAPLNNSGSAFLLHIPPALPEAIDDDFTVQANEATNLDVLANDTINDVMTNFGIAQNPIHGTVSITADNEITFTPEHNICGVQETFTYFISNASGNDTATVTLTINCIVPVAIDDNVTMFLDETKTVDVLANDTQNATPPDVTISFFTLPNHGTATINGDKQIEFAADNIFCGGLDSLSYILNNGMGNDTAMLYITIQCRDIAAVDDATNTLVNNPTTIAVLDNDALFGQLQSVTILQDPTNGTATVTGSHEIDYTPTVDFCGSNDTLTYEVNTTSGIDTAMVVITVYCSIPPPTAVDDVASTLKNTSVTIDALDNDTIIGTLINFVIVDLPAHGTATITGDNTINYTPEADFCGSTDDFTYSIETAEGLDTATVTTNVTCPPAIDAVDDITNTVMNTAVTINVLANDIFDATIDAIGLAGNPSHGLVEIEADQTITYTPEAGFCGDTDQFKYYIEKGGERDTAGVFVNVICTSTLAAADDNVTTNVNTALNINVLSNDTFDGTIDAIGLAGNPAHGLLTIEADNTITYIPEADFCGSTDQFKYYIEKGGERDTATVFVNVVCDSPSAPTANNDNTSTIINTAVDINVLANDTNASSLTTYEIISAPINGTATINGDNTIHYTPTTDFCGDTDSFTYLIINAAGSDTATVSVNVFCISEIPIALPDAGSTYTNTIAIIDVLENDTIVGGITYIGIAQNPTHGIATFNTSNMLSYAPEIGFCGDHDTLSYLVETSAGADTALVIIAVNCITFPAPTAVDDIFEATKNQTGTINVLANDDVPGELIQISIINAPAHGTASVDILTHSINYTPELDYCDAQDSLTYSVETPAGIDTANVIINITCNIEVAGYQGFSPNGDNVNETFKIKNIELYPENYLRIYNRWGNLVYEKENYDNVDGWTGKFHSNDLPDGTYFYVLKLSDGKFIKGYVEMRR